MARGRILFSEHGRRAVSVPVDDLSYPDTTVTTKLHHIRSGAIHDADALTSASKRHDREFLHRVQSSLATPPTLNKTPPILSHHRGLRPPPSRSAYYTAAAAAASSAASSAAASSAPHDLRRRTWYGPTANRVDDYEVDAYLATPARPPFVSRALRSGSVPPVLPSALTGHHHHWAPTSHVREVSVPRWTPSTYRTYGSGRSHLHSDLDVFGTGLSHHRHHGFEHDLDSVDDYPRIPVATRVTSPYFAYRSSPLHGTHEDLDLSPYHHGGGGGGGGSSYPKHHHHHGARSYSVSSYSPSFSHPTHAAATPARFSTLGLSARAASARHAPAASSEFDFDLDLSSSRTPVRSLSSSLHHRASSSALGRHLPTESHIGGSLSTGGISHGSSGSAHVGHSGSSYSLPPLAPPPSAAAPVRSSKPQISETRQRVRDLLCKSKKDPHYFD